uniref:Uncharacterized protein n=1 Tax=Anopheles stephensi TaxID=30069 RepID=A0A182YRD6_ANOST
MAKKISTAEEGCENDAYYIPHHYLLKPTSTTTKLRVVFDGSAVTSNGVALNHVLRKGPAVQRELFSILLSSRSFRYVITADIPKMYRQIRVMSPDTRFQRILWRYCVEDPIEVDLRIDIIYLSSNDVTQRVNEFPEAARVLEQNTYVDDIIAGENDLQRASQLQSDLEKILAKACLGAHKWCSNSKKVLQNIAKEDRGYKLDVIDTNLSIPVKTLGVVWNSDEDWYSFDVSCSQYEANTRRKILSEVGKIYDVLGLVGPVKTLSKLILQLCLKGR